MPLLHLPDADRVDITIEHFIFLSPIEATIFRGDFNSKEYERYMAQLKKIGTAGVGKYDYDSEMPKFYKKIESLIEDAKQGKATIKSISNYLKENLGLMTAFMFWVRRKRFQNKRLKQYNQFMESLANLGVACFIRFWVEYSSLIPIDKIKNKGTQEAVNYIMGKIKKGYGFHKGDKSFYRQKELYKLIIRRLAYDKHFGAIGVIYRVLNLIIKEDDWYPLVGNYYSKKGDAGSLSGDEFASALRTIFTPALESDSPDIENNAQLVFLRKWLEEKSVRERMVKILNSPPQKNKIEILDMGGGTGLSAENFRRNFETALWEVVGEEKIKEIDAKEKLNDYMHINVTDASGELLKTLEENKKNGLIGKNIYYVKANTLPDDVSNNTYDVITSRLFFHHLPFLHQYAIMDKIKKKAKDGAFFFSMDVTNIEPYAKIAYLPLDFACPANNRTGLSALFRECGFDVKDNAYLANIPDSMLITRGVFEAVWAVIKK